MSGSKTESLIPKTLYFKKMYIRSAMHARIRIYCIYILYTRIRTRTYIYIYVYTVYTCICIYLCIDSNEDQKRDIRLSASCRHSDSCSVL